MLRYETRVGRTRDQHNGWDDSPNDVARGDVCVTLNGHAGLLTTDRLTQEGLYSVQA